MLRVFGLVMGVLFSCVVAAQSGRTVWVRVMNLHRLPVADATVELLSTDSTLLKLQLSDSTGLVLFERIAHPLLILRIHSFNHTTHVQSLDSSLNEYTVLLRPRENKLQSVVVNGRKPFIERRADRVVINLESGIATVGTTVMETLQKLPGVSVDGNGSISLKGRPNVLVLMDGKQTYLSPADLATLLSGINANQVAQVELMDIPPANMDAAGSAGVINLVMKKNTIKGFHGSATVGFVQGKYPKTNNNVSLNYRSENVNYFLNYSLNGEQGLSRTNALRTYFKTDGSFYSFLEQPGFGTYTHLSHNLRGGADINFRKKTTVGFVFAGTLYNSAYTYRNQAIWKRSETVVDSVIRTRNLDGTFNRNGQVALNFRHRFNARRELSADVDLIGYSNSRGQFIENSSAAPIPYTEAFRSNIPTGISIIVAKADYSEQLKNTLLSFGWKSSQISTDNLSAYEYFDGQYWRPDAGKSNHFLYDENIHAVYGKAQGKVGRWALQGGLRYEATRYRGIQLVKDSVFRRSYNSLFPTVSAAYTADSSNVFSLNVGRRIDRPPYRSLNPFLFIINKYTYQQGNPFYRPQFTWNAELSHTYKNLLITSLSYSVSTDYFSQVFPTNDNGIVYYTVGNLSRMQNFGASSSLQLSFKNWWNASLQAVVNHKRLEGVVLQRLSANITQYSFYMNNQFRFGKGWSGEVNGYYHSASQEDIQEVLDPYGDLSLGLAKSVAKNKGTLRLSVRDLFYTNWMRGLSYFNRSIETFDLVRDTRLAVFTFTWRFGKSFRADNTQQTGASDEMNRVRDR